MAPVEGSPTGRATPANGVLQLDLAAATVIARDLLLDAATTQTRTRLQIPIAYLVEPAALRHLVGTMTASHCEGTTTDCPYEETTIAISLAAMIRTAAAHPRQHAFAMIEFQEAETATGVGHGRRRRSQEERTFPETISFEESL